MTTTDMVHHAPSLEDISEERWAAKERRAQRLAKVTYVPDHFRRQPDNIIAADLALEAIGYETTPVTLKMCYVVNGTVDFLVDLYKALVYQHGHEMWVVDESDTSATVAGQRAGSDRVHTATFTIDDARKANLLGKENWQKYPRDMLVARASKRVAKRIAPEAIMGLPPPLSIDRTEGRPRVVVGDREVDEDTGEILEGELVDDGDSTQASGADDAAVDAEAHPEGAGAEPGVADQQAEAQPPSASDWKGRAAVAGITQGALLRQARFMADERGFPPPSRLDDLNDSEVADEVGAWLDKFTPAPQDAPA